MTANSAATWLTSLELTGQQVSVTGETDQAPDERPAAKTVAHGDRAYFGWLLTSRSHRSSKRLRSALEPYFAKS